MASCDSCARNRDNRFDVIEGRAKRFADEETKARRLGICGKCENSRFRVCKKCGCFIPFKASLANAKCPIGEW